MSSGDGDPPAPSTSSDNTLLNSLATDLATKYASFTQVDTTGESQQLKDAIEHNLSCLEKFCHELESIRSNSSVCLYTLYPDLVTKIQEMQKVYARIDALEHIMSEVKKTTDVMEAEVERAETVLDSSPSVKKFLVSMFKKQSPEAEVELVEFCPPDIFNTKELFTQEDAVEVVESSKLE